MWGEHRTFKFKLVDINWGSTDIREQLRLDCLTAGSPASLAEGVQDKELKLAVEMSPPLLAAENSPPSLAVGWIIILA